LLPELLQWVNKAIPLSLHFQILRGLGYKGGDIRYFIPELGHYLILISVILLGIFFLVVKEWNRQSSEQAETSSPIAEPAGNS
jgi:ABC-2 type transport system permease protein